MHAYSRSPHSGAGNCNCGMAEHSAVHPHEFAQAWRSEACVCNHPASHPIHTDAATAVAKPVRTGPEAVREAVRAARGGDAPVQVQGYA